MAAPKAKTILVACPKCGHEQQEPKGAYSTVCKACRSHFRVEEALATAAAKSAPAPEPGKPKTRSGRAASAAPKTPDEPSKTTPAIEVPKIAKVQITCLQCGTQLDVPAAAESTMCKRCSSHVDLRDYTIAQTVSKNFRTHGKLVLEEKGYLLNTDSYVGDAVIKGRLIGKINAVRSLEIHTSAQIKGSLGAGRLVVPAGQKFRWAELLRLGGADISGEFVADIQSTGTVTLRATGRLFGNVEAQNFVVENGAIFVGNVRIGKAATTEIPSPVKKKAEVAAQPATASSSYLDSLSDRDL